MRAVGAALRRRLPLLGALGVGYLAGWHLVARWPEATTPQHPRPYAANAVLRPLAVLLDVEAGRAPAAAAAGAAAALEGSLDELIDSLPEAASDCAPGAAPRARREVVALVAAYRRVFPTFRPGGERVRSRLARAPPPSPGLVAFTAPALRRVLSAATGAELAASWAALQGRGAVPEVVIPRDPHHLLVRLEDRGIPGRLLVYGDGRAVTTGPGPEPARGVRRLGEAAVRKLVLDLVRGGLPAPDAYREWLHRGAAGCRWLAPRRRGVVSSTAWPPPPPVAVTLAVGEVRLPGSAAGVRGLERTLAVPEGFLADGCVPDEPVVARLQAAVVERLPAAEGDPLGDAAPDRRRLLQAVARKSIGKDEVRDPRVWPDDGVVVERVDLVEPGPRVEQAHPVEPRHAVGERGPDERLEAAALGREVERVGIGIALARREAGEVVWALGTEIDAGRIDEERCGAEVHRRLEVVDEALARTHRELDPRQRRDVGRSRTGRIDHPGRRDGRAVGEAHGVDTIVMQVETDHLTGDLRDAQRPRLAPEPLEQRVRIEPSLVGQAE